MTKSFVKSLAFVAFIAAISDIARADQWQSASPRPPGEGEGPSRRLLVEGGMLIDGTGAPAYGPVTVVIEGNRIVSIGEPPVANDSEDATTRRIDARGSYVLPGLVDTHVRVLDVGREAMSPDYALKLLLAHGVTTIASMQNMGKAAWAMELSKQSLRNEITAPRVQPWADFDANTPEEARRIVQKLHAMGVQGLGEGHSEGPPAIATAIFAEANRLGMRVSWHMNPMQAQRLNALDAARAGLHGLSHWYGLPETMFSDRQLQRFPPDYNFRDVRSRFRHSADLWSQAAPAGSALRERVLEQLLALDFTLEPTFSVYEANRDYMGVRNAEWHAEYLHPLLRKEFTPSRSGLFAQFYDWSSTDEVRWKNNFRLWMEFVNEYKNRGGRVVAGSDAGYMWTTFGFAFIRNLEMLEEAGFSTLEVVSSATLQSAEHLRVAHEVGSVEVGKLADLLIVPGNPLANLKVLYGTGYDSLDTAGNPVRAGGVRLVIKDGIVFDAAALLDDVRRMVADAKLRQDSVSP